MPKRQRCNRHWLMAAVGNDTATLVAVEVAIFVHKCMKVYHALYLDRPGQQPNQADPEVPPD